MLKKLVIFFSFFLVLAATQSIAADRGRCEGECASCHTLSESEALNLLKKTGGIVKSIKQSPVKGVFELLMDKDGRQGTIFIDYSKKLLIQGLIISLESLQPVMAHAQEMQIAKHVSLVNVASIPTDKAIVMGNSRGAKKLYVFTDPDCPYCLKFHNELKKLERVATDLAIYVFICPLSMHPHAIEKARSLLEINTPEFLDVVFSGKEIPKPVKESSKAGVDSILRFAEVNGITGTPSTVFSDGSLLVGSRDAESLKKLLDEK